MVIAGDVLAGYRRSQMHYSRIARLSFALTLALAPLAATTPAHAEDEFDVSVTGSRVVVSVKGQWHINKEYPWRLVIGESKLDKSKFTLSNDSASIEAPKGVGKLKGGVCNGDQCLRLEKSVTIQ
jgi:hypothetical protein